MCDGSRGACTKATAASDAPVSENGREVIGCVDPNGLDRTNPDTGVTLDALIVMDLK
jgi:hypothetical protein